MYEDLVKRNEKLIEAIIRKAQEVYPASLAMIGIGGSFQTGDVYEKSDLDLLILINDDNGWQLGRTFIQKDLMVGHDLYCTKWEWLENDAQYNDPNIAKLMDAKIVYCADKKYRQRLEKLREKVREKLKQPFNRDDYDKAYKQFKDAKVAFCDLELSQNINEALSSVGEMLYYLENSVAMMNKRYFKRSVKRCLDEIQSMPIVPECFCENVEKIVATREMDEIKDIAIKLIKSAEKAFKELESKLGRTKALPSASNISGTYEEMFSNWRNKMYHAVQLQNRHLSFASLSSFESMLREIQTDVEIGDYEVFGVYDPKDLMKTAKGFDQLLNQYLENYRKAHIKVKEYEDINAFIMEYEK